MGTAARNFLFKVNAQDESANFNDIDFSIEAKMDDTTTFGASVDSTSYTVTLKDGKFTAKGPEVIASSGRMWALLGAAGTTTFEIGPQGSTAGNEKITGNCRVKSIKPAGKVGGVVMIAVEFQADGTVTRTTY